MDKQKTNIEILNEIRNQRNVDLKNAGRNDIFVTKVEVLGVGEKTNKTIFRLIEEREEKNPETGEALINPETLESKKEIWEFFYEYSNGPVLIGVRNPNTHEEIIPVGFNGNEQKNWEEQKQDIEKCLEEREKEIKAIAKELGISEEEINSLSEIDLTQKIEEKEANKEESKKEKSKEEPVKLSEEEVKKTGMTGMNEVKLNSSVDAKGTTLAKALKLDGYSKIMVVHSYKLAELTDSNGEKGNVNRMRFGLIAQKNDGTFEIIPETKLRPYRGENREVTEINNKENIEVKNEECIFEAPGTNKKLVINQKDPYGIPDVYLSQNTRDNDGNIAQKLQDRYDGTEKQDVEVRALFNQNKGINQADKMIDERRKYEKAGQEDLDLDEVDGKNETGDIDFNPNSEEQQKAIEEIMQRGNVSRQEAERKLEQELEGEDDRELEQAKKNAIEQIENEYIGNREKRK